MNNIYNIMNTNENTNDDKLNEIKIIRNIIPSKVIYEYHKKYNLLSYELLYEMTTVEYSFKLNSFYKLFNIYISCRLYTCNYAPNHFCESHIKQEVIDFIIQYFNACVELFDIKKDELNAFREVVYNSDEQQFIDAFENAIIV